MSEIAPQCAPVRIKYSLAVNHKVSVMNRRSRDAIIPYPQFEEAFYEIRTVRACAIDWGDEDHNCLVKDHSRYSSCPASEIGQMNQEEAVGRSHSISQFLWDNCNLLWVRIAGPPLTWQPSMLPVWARGESEAVPLWIPGNEPLMTTSGSISTWSDYRSVVRRLQWLVHAQ